MSTKILVVEDEALYRVLIETSLVNDGHTVTTTQSGSSAIHLLSAESFDLVILDVVMPDMDGFETCSRIRQFSDIPIIFLTGRTEEQDRVKGLDGGGDDYILKPFFATELLARVRVALRRKLNDPNKDNDRFFSHGDLKIDRSRAEVWRAEDQVFLSANEYRMLLILAQNVGTIVSADDLLTRIWGEEYKTEKEILWVSIARLRQKIEVDAHKPTHILTKSGIGYYMPQISPETGKPIKIKLGGIK